MDGPMVYRQGEKQINCDELRWVRNIKFEQVPVGLIEQVYGHPHTHEEWLKWCDWFNQLYNIWNAAAVDETNTIRIFLYGTWDPLLSEMRVVRLTAYPGLFRSNGKVLWKVKEVLMPWARELGMKRVYWESCKWKAMLRKCPGEFKVIDTRLVEVVDVSTPS